MLLASRVPTLYLLWMSVTLDFPGVKLDELRLVASEDFQSTAARELALALYRDGLLPAGRTMELTGLSRRELWETARERGWHLSGDLELVQAR